jgi:hypothetical protein
MTPVGDRLIPFNLIRGSEPEAAMLGAARASEGNIVVVAVLDLKPLRRRLPVMPPRSACFFGGVHERTAH